MMEKPNIETILDFYSMEELLEIAKMKARMQLEETIEEFKAYLFSFSYFGIKPEFQEKEQDVPRADSKSIIKVEHEETGKKKSLKKRILEVVGKKPMTVDEIINALVERGYESKAQDSRRVLYHELGRLINSNALQKAGRGMYRKR